MTGFNKKAVHLQIFFLVYVTVLFANTYHEQGMKLLRNGNYAEASAMLQKAYESDKKDTQVAFDYACVAPCSIAVALFTSISTDKSASDSLQAASWSRLGDYSFVYSAFKTAAEKYRKASGIDPKPWYKHQWALALAALREDEKARSIWHTLTLEYGTDIALQAQYHIGLLDMQVQQYDSAMVRFSKAGKIDEKNSWTIAAAAAQLECAIKLGKKKEIKKLEKQLSPYRDMLLEQDLLQIAEFSKNPPKQKEKKHAKPESKSSEKSEEYTLQVGAFGSIENATALSDKLKKKFDQVTIIPVTLSDQVFYRVRIGSFSSKDDAEAFGESSLSSIGITYKAIMK